MFPEAARGNSGTRGQWGGWEMVWDGGVPRFRKSSAPRTFDDDALRLLLLSLIAERPRHGYDLAREIETRTGGDFTPSVSPIYSTLALLVEMGLIEPQRGEAAKKRFALTEPGSQHLSERKEEAAALSADPGKARAQAPRSAGSPIERAMANLRVVLHGRYRRGGITPDALLQIAGAIDEAARRIERM